MDVVWIASFTFANLFSGTLLYTPQPQASSSTINVSQLEDIGPLLIVPLEVFKSSDAAITVMKMAGFQKFTLIKAKKYVQEYNVSISTGGIAKLTNKK